jgi:hypothetical protein
MLARLDSNLIQTLRDTGEPLPPPERADEFGRMFDRFGGAKLEQIQFNRSHILLQRSSFCTLLE